MAKREKGRNKKARKLLRRVTHQKGAMSPKRIMNQVS